MTVIYLTKYNTKCYRFTLRNNGVVKVQKVEAISNDEINILYIKPLEMFLGKCKVCDMRYCDESISEGKTILLFTSQERARHRYIYIGVDMICSFLTNDKVYEYISNMGNNLIPISIAIGDENMYFLIRHFIFIRRDRIDNNKFLNTIEKNLYPFNYYLSICGKTLLKNYIYIKIIQNMILNYYSL